MYACIYVYILCLYTYVCVDICGYTFILLGLHTGYMHTCIYRYTDICPTRVINNDMYIFNTHYVLNLNPTVYSNAYNIYITIFLIYIYEHTHLMCSIFFSLLAMNIHTPPPP